MRPIKQQCLYANHQWRECSECSCACSKLIPIIGGSLLTVPFSTEPRLNSNVFPRKWFSSWWSHRYVSKIINKDRYRVSLASHRKIINHKYLNLSLSINCIILYEISNSLLQIIDKSLLYTINIIKWMQILFEQQFESLISLSFFFFSCISISRALCFFTYIYR